MRQTVIAVPDNCLPAYPMELNVRKPRFPALSMRRVSLPRAGHPTLDSVFWRALVLVSKDFASEYKDLPCFPGVTRISITGQKTIDWSKLSARTRIKSASSGRQLPSRCVEKPQTARNACNHLPEHSLTSPRMADIKERTDASPTAKPPTADHHRQQQG